MLLLIRVMCTLVAVFGGFVSNNSDSKMRELNAQGAEFDLLAWAFSWSKPHVDKRKGQRSNRKLNGPSGSFSTHDKTRTEETREDIGAVLVEISWNWLGVEVADHCTAARAHQL